MVVVVVVVVVLSAPDGVLIVVLVELLECIMWPHALSANALHRIAAAAAAESLRIMFNSGCERALRVRATVNVAPGYPFLRLV